MQFKLAVCLAGLSGLLVSAATAPDISQPPSGNPIGHPELGELIPAGESYNITWTPTIGGKFLFLPSPLFPGETNCLPPQLLTPVSKTKQHP
jgi:hypothetical protein